MKTIIVLVASALSLISLPAQSLTTMSGRASSMSFAPAEGADRSVIWTTYTASRRLPLGKRVPGGRLHSHEFRPRAGQTGVYEADYIVVSRLAVLEFGSVTLNLPVEDTDTNGVPDLLEFSRSVATTVSGTVRPDYMRGDRLTSETFTGTLQRGANQFEGEYRFSIFNDGDTAIAPFRILSYDGEVMYQRGTRNSMTMVITSHIENATPNTKTVQYRVITPDKVLIPAQWGTIDGQRSRLPRVILNRVGNRYVFTPNNRDGNPHTPWKDYVHWIEQIVDMRDSDTDGIPDLSDPDAGPAN